MAGLGPLKRDILQFVADNDTIKHKTNQKRVYWGEGSYDVSAWHQSRSNLEKHNLLKKAPG